MKIRFYKGVPSRSCMDELIADFFGQWDACNIRCSLTAYGKGWDKNFLLWNNAQFNGQMMAFCEHLRNEYQIETDGFRSAVPPKPGLVNVIRRDNKTSSSPKNTKA